MNCRITLCEILNPLVADPLYLVYVWQKFSILKKEGMIEKISYERRAYESVEDIGAPLRLYLENQRKTNLGQ